MSLVMPMVRSPQVMPRLMEPLAMPMFRVLQVMLPLTVPLVMMMVRALQLIVLGADICWFSALTLAIPGGGPGGRWRPACSPVLAVFVASGVGVAPRQSWRRVEMLLVRVLTMQWRRRW